MVLEGKRRWRWLRVLTHLAALLPLAVLVWDYAQGQLTFNPIREITLRTGRYALTLLVLSLACTPVYIVSGLRPVLQLRRPLGLYAFLYASLHFLTFVGLDFGFDLGLIVDEITQRRFVQAGLLAFLILLPLALTSTKRWIRRLGRNWKRLHRLVYLAALLAIVHFVWLVKGDLRRPLAYGAAVALFLLIRIPGIRETIVELRGRIAQQGQGH
jgi:sulfoxide reductase heme-binding subunit YedZ